MKYWVTCRLMATSYIKYLILNFQYKARNLKFLNVLSKCNDIFVRVSNSFKRHDIFCIIWWLSSCISQFRGLHTIRKSQNIAKFEKFHKTVTKMEKNVQILKKTVENLENPNFFIQSLYFFFKKTVRELLTVYSHPPIVVSLMLLDSSWHDLIGLLFNGYT